MFVFYGIFRLADFSYYPVDFCLQKRDKETAPWGQPLAGRLRAISPTLFGYV